MSTLNQILPDNIWPGSGTALLISGHAYNQGLLQGISVVSNGVNSSSTLLQLATDQIDDCCDKPDPRSCILSGFTTLVRFEPVNESKEVSIEIRAEYKTGEPEVIEQCDIRILQENTVAKSKLEDSDVVICMACWEPDADQLKRQIESIKAQSHKSWHCILNDDFSSDETWARYQDIIGEDSRFSLYRNETNLGFYRNFEVALSRVPAGVNFIALADQDDYWYPEKLVRSIAAFDEQTVLVYCDMRIVDEDGNKISDTYWSGRKNNYKDADVLFLANTVTGAASVFRGDLLETILPFPQAVGQVFHDHWIACVARCQGKLSYVDQPLYDYHQYGNSVIGRCDFEARGVVKRVLDVAANVKHAGKLVKLRSWLLHKRWTALNVFHQEYLRLYLFAEILKMRLPDMSTDAKKGLGMFSADWSAVIRMLQAHFRIVYRKETTDDAELRLAAAVIMFKLDRVYGWFFARRMMKKHCQSLNDSR